MFGDPFWGFMSLWLVVWAVVSVVRTKNGRGGIGGPFSSWHSEPKNTQTPPMFEKMADKFMAERDEELSKLKDRIAVLEKIVTDSHKSHSLSEEIDKLKEN